MANPFDEALKEIYKERMGHDPLAFTKDAIKFIPSALRRSIPQQY